jgi:hypothetical protein
MCVVYRAESLFDCSQCGLKRSQNCLQGRVAISATVGDLLHDFPFVDYSANLDSTEKRMQI